MTALERATLFLLEREMAERHLHEFVKQAWSVVEPEIPFRDNWHIKAVCEHLEATMDGRIPQLIINVPPGTSKSLITCVFFPAWVWATRPAKRFMTASYAEVLSMRDAIRTRDLVLSEWYQERWPVKLKDDQNTKTRYDTDKGGWRIVGSVSGRGIGEHPDCYIADDPHNVLQAESDADRQTVTRWFEGVFCVRGQVRDAKRILIMQRLHALDCAGVAMEKGGWDMLCLPMRYEPDHPTATRREWVEEKDGEQIVHPARPSRLGFVDPRKEDGELLWPSLYTQEKVANLENNMGVYNAAGQLQQRPSPRGGGMFKREWFSVKTQCPPLRRVVRYFDKAGTKDGGGARTAGVAIGEYDDPSADLPSMRTKYVILDVLTGRWEAAEREKVMKDTALNDVARWPCPVTFWVEQEPGSGGKESAQATVGNLAGMTCYMERVTGSKEVRAEPLAAQASVGKVSVLAGEFVSSLLTELEMFPMGKLRDQVDAAGGAFTKLFAPSTAVGGVHDLRSQRQENPFAEAGRMRDFFG